MLEYAVLRGKQDTTKERVRVPNVFIHYNCVMMGFYLTAVANFSEHCFPRGPTYSSHEIKIEIVETKL